MKTILKLLPLILGLAISGAIAYYGEAWSRDNLNFQLWLFIVALLTLSVGALATLNNFE